MGIYSMRSAGSWRPGLNVRLPEAKFETHRINHSPQSWYWQPLYR